MNSIGAFRAYVGSDDVARDLPPAGYRIYGSDITIDNAEQHIRAALYWIPSCDIQVEAEEIGRSIGFNLRRSTVVSTCGSDVPKRQPIQVAALWYSV